MFFIDIRFVDMESLYFLDVDLLFKVIKIFENENKNDLNDVSVLVQVMRFPGEKDYKCDEEWGLMEKDPYMIEHMKLVYGETPVVLNTGSYFMKFEEGNYVCIRRNRYLGCCHNFKQYYPVCFIGCWSSWVTLLLLMRMLCINFIWI